MPRLALALTLTVAFAPAEPQPATSDDRSSDRPQADHAVGVYDEDLRRVVLIGDAGDPVSGRRDRVWSWNGVRWEPASESGPPGRTNAAAAYDARRKRIVVNGGARKASPTGGWEVVGDTWEGDRNGWRQIAAIVPRDHHSLAQNAGGRVLLFGGIPAVRSNPWPADTLELRGDTWRRVATDGPAGRGRAALAYDSKRRQVVLFGGVTAPSRPDGGQIFLNDTWIWEADRWRQAATEGPRGRYAHGMAFDERAGVVLLYGGAAAHKDAPLSDMWQWDGLRWTEVRLTGPTPGHRYQPVMVYDKARGITVLYGGIGGPRDTWEWNGQRWREITPE